MSLSILNGVVLVAGRKTLFAHDSRKRTSANSGRAETHCHVVHILAKRRRRFERGLSPQTERAPTAQNRALPLFSKTGLYSRGRVWKTHLKQATRLLRARSRQFPEESVPRRLGAR